MNLIKKLIYSTLFLLPTYAPATFASEAISVQMEVMMRSPSSIKNMCDRAYYYNSSTGLSYYGYLSEQMRKYAMLNNAQMYNSNAAEANLFERYCPGSY